MSNEIFGLLALVALFGIIFIGFPIAFTLGAVALGAGFIAYGPVVFDLARAADLLGDEGHRAGGSIPFFLFMGFMLEQSRHHGAACSPAYSSCSRDVRTVRCTWPC
jgi:TRAP-type mannitol/chloroaromatic compound transport system permease large subunit